eukprot:1543834-Amphidinium_carterae.1
MAMMGNMNIKLPMPTQFDGRNPQFNKWAGEVKAYLTIHNVHITWGLEGRLRQVTSGTFRIPTLQMMSQNYHNGFPMQQQRTNIRHKRDEITNFSQTLNDVSAHSTKPGSETHSMIRKIMRIQWCGISDSCLQLVDLPHA